jgi:hypothetical protein
MDPGVEMSGWSVDPYGAKFEDGWVSARKCLLDWTFRSVALPDKVTASMRGEDPEGRVRISLVGE